MCHCHYSYSIKLKKKKNFIIFSESSALAFIMELLPKGFEFYTTYAVLSTSACNPYSLAKMKDVMDCGSAACNIIE